MVNDKNAQRFHTNTMPEQNIARLRPLWIHASSGEIEYAKPVLRLLKKRFPDIPLLVTYSSPSAKKMLRDLPGVDAWGPLPWDFDGPCEKFVKRWQPRALFVARTDVWPVVAEVCKRHQIPGLLFSATFAENSSRLRGLSKYVTAWALNQLSEIHCVSEADASEVRKLNLSTPVSVHGDTRFDQVFHRLAHPKPLREEAQPLSTKRVLVAGSTWNEDEQVLIPALAKLRGTVRLILVPHEVNEKHLQEIQSELSTRGLSYTLYSRASKWDTDVLVVDKVGILAELYTWGEMAFVGGSFKKQVHSVMEPLAAGLPVFVGPYHLNNREALYFQRREVAGFAPVSEVRNVENLVEKINAFLTVDSSTFGRSLQNEMRALANASPAVIEWYATRFQA